MRPVALTAATLFVRWDAVPYMSSTMSDSAAHACQKQSEGSSAEKHVVQSQECIHKATTNSGCQLCWPAEHNH